MRNSGFFSEDRPYYPILITFNVILTTFLTISAAVSTMISSSAIQGELALSDTEALWLTTLNLLGINITVPTGNWFANHFGFKRTYATGVFIFAFASFLAGCASNFFMIALARLVEGIGAGLIFPVGLSLIIQNLPKNRISLGVNLYIAGAFGAGLGLGVPLSGYLAQFHSWRDLFFLISAFAIPAGLSCWETRAIKPEHERIPFDFLGFITFAIFISTLLVALTMGPIRATSEGWRSLYIIAFFFLALISLIVCLYAESRHPYPLIPLPLFKDPIFSVSLAAMFLLGMATFASVSVAVEYMLNGLFYEKFVTGKIAAIYGIVMAAVSIFASFLAKRIPIPILTFLGLFLLIFSYFYNNQLSFLTGATQVLIILTIRGVGIGFALGSTTLLALAEVPKELKGAAATILTFFRQIGGTYGGTLISIVSIRQTIFHTARFAEQTNPQLPGYQETLQSLSTQFSSEAVGKALIIQNLQTQAYIQGLNDALIFFGYVTGFVTLILMILIGYRMMKKQYVDKIS